MGSTGPLPRGDAGGSKLAEPIREARRVRLGRTIYRIQRIRILTAVGSSARRNGVQLNQLFHWRKLAAQGALTATAAEGEVVAASEYRALQNQVRELQRLLGKKTMETEILKDELAAGSKKQMLRSLSWPKNGSR